MSRQRKKISPERQARIIAELRRDQELKQKSYRDRALRIYPHICARCGREFSGKRLRELTVHHKDHNHKNNPNDGSNWELLCLYCHDHEHEKQRIAGCYDQSIADDKDSLPSIFEQFKDLDTLLNHEKPDS
jgi:5-methylcytosine-specific restriction endonuclease McrA